MSIESDKARSTGTRSAAAGVVVVGSANLDVVSQVDHIPRAGETILASAKAQSAGGKGANQAIAVARAGASTTFIGAVGRDSAASAILRELVAADVVDLARRVDYPTGTAYITVDSAGENTIVVSPGANSSLTSLTAAERETIQGSDYVLLQLETPLALVTEVAALARAASTIVVLNASPIQVLGPEFLDVVDILIVNESEALELAAQQQPVTVAPGSLSAENAADVVRLLLKLVPTVILTLGGDGALIADREAGFPTAIPAFPTRVVDTTGAGDTFCGALVAALSRGAALAEAAVFASAAGALSVQSRGAIPSIPTRESITSFLADQTD